MKGSRLYIIFILLFLVILFIFEHNLPKQFVWRATFSQNDHQPFGCAVFDDVVSVSFPLDYEVIDKTFYQLNNSLEDENEESPSYHILSISERLELTKLDIEALLSLAANGSKIMLVASSFNEELSDTLVFGCSYEYYNIHNLRKYATTYFTRDTICWKDTLHYPTGCFGFYPHVCPAYFYDSDSLNITLAEKVEYYSSLNEDSTEISENYSYPVAITQPIGKGEITLVSTPYLFTNYGMLDHGNAAYLFRLLSRLKDAPLVRTEAYGPMKGEQQSPFRYFLSQPPLRWGLYMTIIVLILFMIFTARRKQRVIPVIRQPQNKSLEFTELIGTLYFQKKNHSDLVRKKYIYFAETLRRTIQVNIENEENDTELAEHLAHKTGMEKEKVEITLRKIRPVVRGEKKVDETEMKNLIDEINQIINHL
ncbi:MAG: DUF4350 domain-containing protein [Bacteroides sp.]|nr:DUF4350 domain-containing protein [Bacteroides sp.]